MEISSGRWTRLVHAFEGYEKSGVSLVGWNGSAYIPPETGDDIGLYYFVPKLASLFNLPLSQALSLFFNSVIVLSCLLGCVGIFQLYKKQTSRLLGCSVVLGMGVLSYLSRDVYFMLSCVVLAFVPLGLVVLKENKLSIGSIVYFLTAGLGAGMANMVRMHSGTPVILFLLTALIIIFVRDRDKKPLLFGGLLVIFFILPSLFTNYLVQHRNSYIENMDSHYEVAPDEHLFWHAVYVGLSYLTNDYDVPKWDRLVIEQVEQAAPGTKKYSIEYENIVRGFVFDLMKEHPFFIVRTIFAKFGVMLIYILFFANLGLIYAIRFPKGWKVDFIFWISIGFCSLNGFLVTPYHFYLLGMMAFLALYGVISINQKKEPIYIF